MKIHAVQTGTVTIRPNQRQGKGIGLARLVNTLFDRRWTESLPIYAWVIEHPEGIIVIDISIHPKEVRKIDGLTLNSREA